MPGILTYSPALMALYVALNALIVLVLNMLVSRAQAVASGRGQSDAAARASLAYTASAEVLPIPLLLMLIATSLGAVFWLIHAIGAPLTIGQMLHGFGASRSENASLVRYFGLVLIWVSYIAGIAALIWLIFANPPA
jgi:uncharacterized membrane protein YecN with MAPEG domain